MYDTVLNERRTQLDWGLLAAVGGLMLVGVSFIYSATSVQESLNALPWYRQYAFQQFVWYLLGLTVAAAFCLVDYRVWARWSLVFYWLMILMLVLVFFTSAVKGSRRWINFGFYKFQPSEFTKLAFIFAQAHFLSRPRDELREPAVFWKGIGLTLLPFILIFFEPDFGSALVLFPVGLVMMFVAGVPVAFLRRLIGGAGLMIALILVDVLFAPPGWKIKLEDYQRRRLLVYFGRDIVPPNASKEARNLARLQQLKYSYNVRQALISVGSGGLTGKGWRQGDQVRLGYLPLGVAHNDFIFSVIAEEKGFLGSVTVIALYGLILLTGLRTASQARDRLGKLLAIGVVTLFFSHIFINIGMNIRLMPVTGIPLPLLSYGGSSVLCSLIAAGMLQNVYRYRKVY